MEAGCFYVVGVAGFEPTTSSSRTKHATKLRHTPREATTAYRTGGVRSQTLEAGLTRGQRLSPGIPQYRQTLAVLGLVHLALGVGVAHRALPTAAPRRRATAATTTGISHTAGRRRASMSRSIFET